LAQLIFVRRPHPASCVFLEYYDLLREYCDLRFPLCFHGVHLQFFRLSPLDQKTVGMDHEVPILRWRLKCRPLAPLRQS
jgi:hypothetical protein